MSSDKPTSTAPVITRTEVTWRGERLFDAGPAGRQHRIDAGAKEAPGPVETLLNAIATCSSVDVIDIIAKRKTPVERMAVNVVGTRRSEFPRRLIALDIEFRIDGVGIEREHAERAIQLSFERYCSVAASLAPDIVVHATLTLNDETFPPVPQKVWTPEPTTAAH
ncbi:MAG TPA: OsmC family protein [Gemmatimonadaceae bacterium]|jgi:putative redox protein